jgi:hypothetical protein
MLQSKIKIRKQYFIKNRNIESTKGNITVRIHLLEEERNQTLDENRLKDKFRQMETEDIEDNRVSIKQATLEAAKESLGYKPIKKKTRIRTWKEELKQIIDRKKHECKVYLQTKDQQQQIKYKKLGEEVKTNQKDSAGWLGQSCEIIQT